MTLDTLPLLTPEQWREFSDGIRFPVAERAEIALRGERLLERQVVYVVGRVRRETLDNDLIVFGKRAEKVHLSRYFVGGEGYPYGELGECSVSEITDYTPI